MTEFELDPNGDPVGLPVESWVARPRPARQPMAGRLTDLVPLDVGHAEGLHAAYRRDEAGRMWTYLGVGPFARLEDFRVWIDGCAASTDPLFFAVIDRTSGQPVGMVSHLRIDSAFGVVEVGWVTWSPQMQRTAMATEAQYLMMRRAFDDLGYRRYEWKCNALNAPSVAAARRLGFTYEGTFRQATVAKGRNRDTAWFSVIDGEWPALKAAFEAWLDPANFDADGRQLRRLEDCRTGA